MGIIALDGESSPYTLSQSSYYHVLDWGAWVENTIGDMFTGALLIVRSPLSGIIHTYYNDSFTAEGIKISQTLASTPNALSINDAYNNVFGDNGKAARVTREVESSHYRQSEVDFCIGSDDRGGLDRRNVRLNPDAHNASDIVLVIQDGEDNRCRD